ncbi:hypothetical protein ACVI1J_003280 [Bradyrhizobium diazoefficiens]
MARAPGHREPQRYRHPGLESDAGRPAGRADRSAHGFLSCGLRASGRLLDCAPPFSAGGTPVSFNRGRVERQYDAVFARLGQRFEDCAPSSSLGPAIEAIVDRRVRAVFTWTITPSCTRLQHVNDAADDASVVVPIRPRQSPRQMRFDTRHCLSFSQNKPARILSPPNQHVGKRITWRYLGTDPSTHFSWNVSRDSRSG